MCLLVVRNVTGNRIAENPIFIRQPRLLEDYSDAQLYNNMRIRSRAHIPRLLLAYILVFNASTAILCAMFFQH
jgi:hypothetical protein